MPELENQPLRLRALDGPPGSPRYSVTVEVCSAGACPHGVPAQLARAGQCPVDICPLRRCVRLLLDRRGTVLQETESTAHWSWNSLRACSPTDWTKSHIPYFGCGITTLYYRAFPHKGPAVGYHTANVFWYCRHSAGL